MYLTEILVSTVPSGISYIRNRISGLSILREGRRNRPNAGFAPEQMDIDRKHNITDPTLKPKTDPDPVHLPHIFAKSSFFYTWKNSICENLLTLKILLFFFQGYNKTLFIPFYAVLYTQNSDPDPKH